MIFNVEGHIQKIISGEKTQTRRSNNRRKRGKLYAVQAGRTKKGIPEGKIYMGMVVKEWKPDLSDIPEHATFARSYRRMESGYPISVSDAKAEGGYTPFDYEELYEKLFPKWAERWRYDFRFFTSKELDDMKLETIVR
ncbi:MAG: hypothetical protein ACTSRU_12725 [Candidatus Hodarchaeales archaeon]